MFYQGEWGSDRSHARFQMLRDFYQTSSLANRSFRASRHRVETISLQPEIQRNLYLAENKSSAYKKKYRI